MKTKPKPKTQPPVPVKLVDQGAIRLMDEAAERLGGVARRVVIEALLKQYAPDLRVGVGK